MSAIPRPYRDAHVGEIVLFHPTGDPSSAPIPLMVEEAGKGWATLAGTIPGSIAVFRRKYVKHIHDPFWDNATVQAKQSNGAYDFHPAYKGVFDRAQQAADARAAARQKREQEKDEMSDEDFEALKALEMHGPNISAISRDTGLSTYKLNKLPKFNEALMAAKKQRWREKNDIDDEVEQEVAAE